MDAPTDVGQRPASRLDGKWRVRVGLLIFVLSTMISLVLI
jgi:hypothetical protein